jgi:hypothetical protein
MTTKSLIYFFVSALTPIFLFIFGVVYGYVESSGRLIFWRSLGSPQEKVAKILGLDSYDVFVETTDKKIYKANLNKCKWPYISCWEETEIFEELPALVYKQNCWHDFVVSEPSGQIIQVIKIKDCGSGGATQTNFALMADGKVKVWTHTITDLEPLLWVYNGFRLAFGGFVIVILVINAIEDKWLSWLVKKIKRQSE